MEEKGKEGEVRGEVGQRRGRETEKGVWRVKGRK